MSEDFKYLAKAVKSRFDSFLKEDTLYVVDSTSEDIWNTYLNSFPAGSNPIFRVRSEHDCACCRSFIKNIGNVVAIQNGTIASLWNLTALPEPYQTVADVMSDYISSRKISDIFLTKEKKFGQEKSIAQIEGAMYQWNHFCVDVSSSFVTPKKDEKRGEARTTLDVFQRGLNELKTSALTDVIDLIKENAIYRGKEFEKSVKEFAKLQERYDGLRRGSKQVFLWQNVGSPYARFKNSVIGTLVSDLSEGEKLEDAVRMFESKVAPQNYKRSSSLITKTMIKDAMKQIQELDLEPALERRHAKFSDIDINDVLFVDNSVAAKLKNSKLTSMLLEEVKPAKLDLNHAKEISVDDFLKKVVPKTTSLSLYLENRHSGNLVSLTAPIHDDVAPIFRWKNNIAWSYAGNVTDSIKERVKKAGGMVENVDLRVSLAWFNTDDLDLHIYGPSASEHIFFGNKGDIHPNGGMLDVDMNVFNLVRDPVENVRWRRIMRDGVYRASVHSYTKREQIDVGFALEIEHDGQLSTFTHTKAVGNNDSIAVCYIEVKNKRVVNIESINKNVVAGYASKDLWGVKTQELVKVNSLIASPNYWQEEEGGNKHWFFILEGCKNPEETRGIYNEFLSPKLAKHRKVFEVLGDKTKCKVVDEQMSGLGFSFTKKDSVSVVATGPKLNQLYTVVF